MAIELEIIQPWDGQTGTGAEVRTAINRNFEKLAIELGNPATGAKFGGSIDPSFNLLEIKDPTWFFATEGNYQTNDGVVTVIGMSILSFNGETWSTQQLPTEIQLTNDFFEII